MHFELKKKRYHDYRLTGTEPRTGTKYSVPVWVPKKQVFWY